MTFDPFLDVPLFQLSEGQLATEATQIVEVRDGSPMMAFAHRSGGYATLTVLEVFRTDAGHEPFLVGGNVAGMPRIGQLCQGQGPLGGLPIFDAANALPRFIKQSNPPFGTGQREVPTIGLFPMPGGAMGLSTLFAASGHRTTNSISRG